MMVAPSSRSRLMAGEICVAVGLAFEPHFKAAVEKEPSRLNALAGAAQATDHLGDRDSFRELTAFAGTADTARHDLVATRDFWVRN